MLPMSIILAAIGTLLLAMIPILVAITAWESGDLAQMTIAGAALHIILFIFAEAGFVTPGYVTIRDTLQDIRRTDPGYRLMPTFGWPLWIRRLYRTVLDSMTAKHRGDGTLWLCPNMRLNFERATSIARIAVHANLGPCLCGQHFTSITNDGYIFQAFPIDTFDREEMTFFSITNLLASCQMRVCPHTSVSSPHLMESFDASCTRTFAQTILECQCRKCVNGLIYTCSRCRTEFGFRLRKCRSGRETLFLLVSKPLLEEALTQDGYGVWKGLANTPGEIIERESEFEEYKICCAVTAEEREELMLRDPYNWE
ncbi:MAG: hypothetical protein Q9218_007504 [Villophora microphyllina]